MLFAEVRGKLGRDGSRAHDRAEDLLTSTAFQLLRYLPFESGLAAVLGKVRAVGADGSVTADVPAWLMRPGVTDAKYDPWPRWPGFGEPDMVVTLFAGAAVAGRAVIEVKLDAGKSGENDEEPGEGAAEVPARDQLVRYRRGLCERFGVEALGVVYLTSHAIPPADELAASVKNEPGYWLGWLSWRDVWSALRACDQRPARDLAAILAAKGLKRFEGFQLGALPPLGLSTFWFQTSRARQRRAGWFGMTPGVTSADARFWKGV